MRIYNSDNDSTANNITLLLKASEAKELIGSLKSLLDNAETSMHHHINDTTYKHEITVCLYDEDNKHMENFHKRIQEVIIYDK